MEKQTRKKTNNDSEQGEQEGVLKEMSFLEHLGDLRSVLIQSLIAFLTLSIICWFFSGWILDLLVSDVPVDSLYFTSPVEAFMARMKVSFVLGLLLAFPFILYKIWAFVSPGLFTRERGKIYPLVVVSSMLFYLGVLFCYLILIPIVLRFLLGFGTDYLNPLISVNSYFLFVARLCFTFGIVFQIPVVVLVLSLAGLITPRTLLKHWRYGVVGIFAGSAVLTPPDAVSLAMMAVPILLLYMGSIVIAMVVVRRREDED